MLREALLSRFKDECTLVEHRFVDGTSKLIPHWKHVHPPVRDVNKQFRESFSPLERVALSGHDRIPYRP